MRLRLRASYTVAPFLAQVPYSTSLYRSIKRISIASSSFIAPYKFDLLRADTLISQSNIHAVADSGRKSKNTCKTRFSRREYSEPGITAKTDPTETASTMVTNARTALEEQGSKGEFLRRDAAWRNWVKNGKLFYLSKGFVSYEPFT
jgi:hypothetical protein